MKNTHTDQVIVAWIPKKFAVVGKTVQLKIDDLWIDGWLIKETYASVLEKFAEEHERDYKLFPTALGK